ncbi:DM13 domain-containing protein [Candidatus Pacearchaeota archaeon]|nr:DM13 domain-containing protein [Candidatus Pacearchaeota archaeon]
MPHMNRKRPLILGLVIVILIIAYYLISPLFIVKEANDDLPEVSYGMMEAGVKVEPVQKILSASLLPYAHDVSGTVSVYDSMGQKTLRFEDFETINSPDLFIYLATDATADEFVNLGEIRATKGNVNYEIPLDVDLEKYDTVLVWCRAFRTLFSYAELKE